MEPIVATRRIPCQSEQRALWRAIAQTDRFNRMIGNAAIEPRAAEGQGLARHVVKQRLAGLRLEYEELPFEWSEPDFISITRVFRNGPAARYRVLWRFEPGDDGGTVIEQTLELTARARIYSPFLRINSRRYTKKMVAAIQQIDGNLAAGRPAYPTRANLAADPVVLGRVGSALRRAVGSAGTAIADRLLEFVASADDIDAGRIRPYELAAEWGIDDRHGRRQVLEVCLQGVVSGVLDLSWDVICPSCRTASDQVASLDDLGERGHCHVCDLSIHIDLDRAVEATFRPAGAVRSIGNETYCISGPFRTPHVITQAVLRTGETLELNAPKEPGRYRLFVRGGITASVEVDPDGPEHANYGSGHTGEVSLSVGPGAVISMRGVGKDDRHVKLEHLDWASMAATAHEVSTIRSFRDRFSAEVLTPGTMLEVSRVAFLFTDLIGHTRLYATLGDAGAYRFVQDHFRILADVVEEHDGTLVKTIGDAIMAAFADERAAVDASLAIQRAYTTFAQKAGKYEEVGLRVGVHAGPCFAVTANRQLDYFGTTVITAQRLQDQAERGQVVIAAELYDRVVGDGQLPGARVLEELYAEIKGFDDLVRARRIDPFAE